MRERPSTIRILPSSNHCSMMMSIALCRWFIIIWWQRSRCACGMHSNHRRNGGSGRRGAGTLNHQLGVRVFVFAFCLNACVRVCTALGLHILVRLSLCPSVSFYGTLPFAFAVPPSPLMRPSSSSCHMRWHSNYVHKQLLLLLLLNLCISSTWAACLTACVCVRLVRACFCVCMYTHAFAGCWVLGA